jgi:hypothetical protein
VNQGERAPRATGGREGATGLARGAAKATASGAPRASRWRRFALPLRNLAAAVVLGVATLFMLKTEADQHWSDPPVVAVVVAYDQAAHPDEAT